MNTDPSTQVPTDPWTTAQQKCWTHVETATTMTKVLEALKGLSVAAVIPILADNRPTLMLSPTEANDIICVKATVRVISKGLQDAGIIDSVAEWQKMPMGGEWLLRCVVPNGIIIDVMTQLPATKESPIEV